MLVQLYNMHLSYAAQYFVMLYNLQRLSVVYACVLFEHLQY